MKKHILVLLLSLSAVAAQAQVVLEDFSTTMRSGFTYFYGSWSSTGSTSVGSEVPIAGLTQGSGIFSIDSAAATNADTAKLEIYFANPLDLSNTTQLTLEAQSLTGNGAASLRIFLFDGNGFVGSAAFDLTQFPVGAFTPVTQLLTLNSGASLAAVEGFVITGNIPGGSAAFRVAFNSLVTGAAAIPEPSTYAAIAGVLMLGFVVYRRRQQAVAA